mgnify:CR=1 FL=1
MEDLSDPKPESPFFVQDSNGKVVIHTKSNPHHDGLQKSFRVVEAGWNTAKKSISTSISTQVDESDLGIDDLDQQTEDNIDNNEDLGFDEQLLVDSSKALQPSSENGKKSEMSVSTKRVTDMAVRKFRGMCNVITLPRLSVNIVNICLHISFFNNSAIYINLLFT